MVIRMLTHNRHALALLCFCVGSSMQELWCQCKELWCKCEPGKVKNCNWKGAIVTHCTLMKRCPWCENCLNKTLNPKAAIWNLEYHECCLVVKGIWLAIIYFYFQNKFVLTSSVFFWPNWGFSSSLQWWVLVLTWLAGWLADSVDNSNKPHVFYIAMDGTSPCSLVFTSRVCHEPKAY
jgi:hypothetical protein